ncbi:sulfurtransferase [Poseidonocella sp. HB161398]|uniref:sulfurtransferase n=1 Tax=Poseidonocella sp. HB161398 TaxID=2320855 RepID=UPI0011083FE3|nr:sulfurtransferase [Poseidonocella sp. HB161398]
MTDPDPHLVSPEWLAENLDRPDLVVVDCSWFVPEFEKTGRGEFENGHIPGAQFLDLDAISDARAPNVNMLCSPEQFAAEAGALGIANETEVIIYDAVYVSARVWWMFRLFSHDRVRILDGGLRRWTAEGRALASGPALPATPARYDARPPADEVVGWAPVLDALQSGSHSVLDARTPGRFTGEMSSGYPGVAGGHMPGAVNVSWQDLIRQEAPFTFLAPDAARACFEAAGADLSRPVIATCGSGVTACIIAFQLDRMGKRDWKIYDASWHEWGQRADLPKESL